MSDRQQLSLWPDPSYDGNRARHFRRKGWSESYYRTYLSSRQWECRREQAMDAANYRCEGCGAETRFEIHHRTYAHLGDEYPGDLEALCRQCHERAHLPPQTSGRQKSPQLWLP